jgi:WD40 repeat protein
VQALQLALAAWREKPGNVDAFGALFQQRLYWHEVDRVLTQPQFRDVRTMESSADGRVVVLIPNNPFTKPTVWWDLLSPDARHREISADPRSYFVLSPDGRMLAVSDQAHGLRIWDLNQPGEPIVLDPRVTWDPSFSADGRFLALSSETNPEHVRVWDLDGMREIRTQVSYARTNPVPTGGFYPSPDGRSLVATEYKRDNLEGEHVYEAVVRDLMTGAEIRSFPMSDDAEVRLLGNGTQVAICTGGELTLYDVFSDTPNRQFRVPNCFITLDASGRYIEDSAYNQILDWKDGTELTFGTSAFPDMWTEAEPLLSRAPDGTFNAISNRDGVLQVYALVPRPGHVERLDTWSLLTFANDRGMSWVSYNGFDPGTGQGEIALLGSDGGVLSRRPVPQEPEGMAFDASGDRLAVAMGTKLLIYRTDGLVLEHEARLPVPEGRTDDDLARSDGGSVAPTLDGRILVSRMGILSFWDPQFAVQTAPPLVLENPTQWDRVPDGPNVALRPGHPEQLLVQSRNKFAVWDLRERRQLREFQLGELSSLAVSENGSVAALPTGSMITLVDLRNMTALPPLNSQGTKIIGINGDYLFAKDTQTLQVWHWPTYRQVTSMDLPRDASQGIVGNKFFPDREPGRQEPISLDAGVWFRDLCRIGDREFTVQEGLLPPGASAEPPCR